MQKQRFFKDNQYDHVIDQVRKLLGNKLFKQNPKIRWVPSQGTREEGILLAMAGVRIPPASIGWFQKRLDGHIKYKFVDRKDGNKTLYIVDVDQSVTLSNFLRDYPTMSPSNRYLLDLQFGNTPSGEVALERIRSTAANKFVEQLENEIKRQEGIVFTDEMRADCKERVIHLFKQQYSAGTMDQVHRPEDLIALFTPIKTAIIEQYRTEQNKTIHPN